MRGMAVAVVVLVVVGLAGCGGSGGSRGPAIVTGQSLGDSLAVAAKKRYEELGLFSTQVGDQGGLCQGGGARWTCRLDILLHDTIRDVRAYDMAVNGKGCWVARQTGTDVGVTGRPARPSNPEVLRGCVPY
ncbi:MAG: hypothetical protein M3155_03390 [Actinomycetota bacterium]|nr:hypothetical protein [Actinomycetota bacterium]